MKTKLYETMAGKLEERLRGDPRGGLPSLNALAREFGVSYRTAWKAAQVLLGKGLIANAPGRRFVAGRELGTGEDAGGQPQSTEDVLYAKIRSGLEDGTYAVGKPFPKSRYFALAQHVSLATVSRAMHRLAGDNLAHKEGKAWIAGPQRAGHRHQISSSPDIVMLILPGPQDWFHIFMMDFTQGYIVPFRNELVQHGIQLQVAVRRHLPDAPFGSISGPEEMTRWARERAEHYRGAFIQSVDIPKDSLEELIPDLYRLGKPLVFFDSSGQGAELTRSRLGVGRNYYRFNYDERLVVETALGNLVQAGHRVIGTHGYGTHPWSERRLAMIKECASRIAPEIRIVESAPAERDWDFVSVDYGTGITMPSGEIHLDPGLGEEARSRLCAERTSLTRMLTDHAPTALISPCDSYAQEQYWVLRALGVRIPEDLSMVSFDNTPHSILFPVSTVDFGFARMGYLAAHVLIGDIGIRADRQGSIPGICSLVNRGSVGTPNKDKGRFRRSFGVIGSR